MRKIILISTIVFITNVVVAQAPNWEWAKSPISTDNVNILTSIAIDADDNTYTAGSFKTPIIVFGTDTLVNSDGTGMTKNMFIVKHDSFGNLIWAKKSGGNCNSISSAITASSSGYVYVTGTYYSPFVIFGNDTLTCSGASDIFIVKYDSNGNVIWAKKAGNSSIDSPGSIAVDSSDNIYIAGSFSNFNIVIGSSTLINKGMTDMFVAKYDSNGNVIWAKSSGNISGEHASSIALDGSGNSYVTVGYRSQNLVFGSDTLVNTDVGEDDIGIIKYDSTGNVIWARNAGGTSDDWPSSIKADSSGNIYISGNFHSTTILFGSTTLTNPSSTGWANVFLVKYDTNGNLSWAKNAGGGSSVGRSLSIDPSGNIYIVGNFLSPSISFGTLTLVGGADIFMVKYDTTGLALWAERIGGDYDDIATSVSAGNADQIYMTGSFNSTNIVFDTDTLTNSASAGIYNIFIAKMQELVITEIPLNNETRKFNLAFPNPFSNSTTIQFNQQLKDALLNLFNARGEKVKSISYSGESIKIERENLNSGMYYYQIVQENGNVLNGKLMIVD